MGERARDRAAAVTPMSTLPNRTSPTRRTIVFGCAVACLASAPWQAPSSPPLPTQKAADASSGATVLAPPLEGMVPIAAGTFEMGSGGVEQKYAIELCKEEVLGAFCKNEKSPIPMNVFAFEGLPHMVTLPAFRIDRTEVTVAAYRRCVDLGECKPPGFATGDAKHDRPEFPVSFVSWEDARKYCAFRKARLPTEAEWERAARGSTGRRFPWGMLGNPKLANHGALDAGSAIGPKTGLIYFGVADDGDGFAGLAEVGSFPSGATPEGIVDLAGNAAEWVEDAWSDQYDPTPVTAPTGPASGVERVIRGGSYRQAMPMLRGAARMFRMQSEREPDLGFRCARDF